MPTKAADMLIARRADTRAQGRFCDLEDAGQTQRLLRPARRGAELSGKLPAAAGEDDRGGGLRGHHPAHVQELLCRDGRLRDAAGNTLARQRAGHRYRQRHRVPPPAARAKPAPSGPAAKPRLPVALIFICLAVVYVSIRYFWR